MEGDSVIVRRVELGRAGCDGVQEGVDAAGVEARRCGCNLSVEARRPGVEARRPGVEAKRPGVWAKRPGVGACGASKGASPETEAGGHRSKCRLRHEIATPGVKESAALHPAYLKGKAVSRAASR
jgi:hypothetical protein